MTVKGDYPKSQHGNFEVVDSIGVPHPYCITPKHIAHASDRCGGILNETAIREAEQTGARCGCRGCNLPYDQHEQALLVKCHSDFQTDPQAEQELRDYLLAIKETTEQNGYVGFAFTKS